MKKFFPLFLMAAVLAFGACQKDEGPGNILRYDGENATGPLLAAGFYEAAARFTPNETARFTGRQLLAVRFFMGPRPQTTEVRVYGPGSNSRPGNLLYSAAISSQVESNKWNEHTLTTPLDITGEELWISIAFTHGQQTQSIGCDAGPRNSNGDWLFDSNDNQWRTYLQRTGESVNWNVRGIVSE